jgi:hypothetical protein
MSAMRQAFPIPKSAQASKDQDLSAYKIDPGNMLAPRSRQNSAADQTASSSKPDTSMKHAKETQNTSSNAFGARSSNAVGQTSAHVQKARFGEPSHPNGASSKRKVKPPAKETGPYLPESHANQHEEAIPKSRQNNAALTSNETSARIGEQTSNAQHANRKRLRQRTETTKDISNYKNVTHETRRQTPDAEVVEYPSKRRQNDRPALNGHALQSASQELDIMEIPESDIPSSQPSCERYLNGVNDCMEEDEEFDLITDSRPPKHPQSSPQDVCCLLHHV